MFSTKLLVIYFWVFFLAFLLKRSEYNEYKNKSEFWLSKNTLLFGIGFFLSIYSLIFVNYSNLDQFKKETSEKFILSDDFDDIKSDTIDLAYEFDHLDKNFNSIPHHLAFFKKYYGIENSERRDLLVEQYYWDKTNFTDSTVVNIATWGNSITQCMINSCSNKIEVLMQEKFRNLPISKYIIGQCLLSKKEYDSAFVYLRSEYELGELSDFHPLKRDLGFVGVELKKYDFLVDYFLRHPDIMQLFDDKLVATVFFFNSNPIKYFKYRLASSYSGINAAGVIFALLIFATWFYYLIRLDIYEKERPIIVIGVILMALFTTELAFPIYDFFKYVLFFDMNGKFFNDLLYCVFGIGLIEEVVKLLPLLFLMAFTKEPNDTYDYLLYASISALTFATIENIMYFGDERLAGYSGRSMYAVILHLSCSSVAAYGLMLAKFRNNWPAKAKDILTYFLVAICMHGLYDFFIFYRFTVFFYLGFLGSVVVWIVMLNNAMNNSKFFSYNVAVKSVNLRMFLGVSLMVLFFAEYIYYAFRDGKYGANMFFVSNAVGFSLLTFFFTSRLAQFDLIRGYWRTVQWKDVSDTTQVEIFHPWEWPKLVFGFFFNFFDLNSIKPQNYVGIKLKIFLRNERGTFGPDWVELKIVDRVVIIIRNPTTRKLYRDPKWFVGIVDSHSDHLITPMFYLFKTQTKGDSLTKRNKEIVELAIPANESVLTRHLISFKELSEVTLGLATKVAE